MTSTITRKIVRIDEDLCNGCGDCIPSCAEGALRLVNGKVKLVADKLCDGLGACLGHCPMGAITIEERPAEEFDEHAVEAHLHSSAVPAPAVEPAHGHGHGGGCPGSRLRVLAPQGPRPMPVAGAERRSRLGQWPVQLALLPPTAPLWQDAEVLIAADCVPFACADFHEKLLAGRALAIACPKLDDVKPYVQKLTAIFASNRIKSVTVAHMEVPCCTGLLRVVEMALAQAGRQDIPLRSVVIGVDGENRN